MTDNKEENMVSEGALINAIMQVESLNQEINVLKNKIEIEIEKSKVSKHLIDNITIENIELRAQLNFIQKRIESAQSPGIPEKKTEQTDELKREEVSSSQKESDAIETKE